MQKLYLVAVSRFPLTELVQQLNASALAIVVADFIIYKREQHACATAADLPLYIHLGQLWPTDDSRRIPDPEDLIRELMPIMRAGDVLAHPFTRYPGGFVSAKSAFVSRGGHHARNGSTGNVFGTGGADSHGKRIVTMHGDCHLLKSPHALLHDRPAERVLSPIVVRHEPVGVRQVGPGQPRQR